MLASSSLIFSGRALGLSTLLMAKIIGTPATWAWLIASLVWGMMLSSAAITMIATSVILAPRALIAVKASWPGVSRKAILLPVLVRTSYAPMCWVIPPASAAVTFDIRIKSSKDVLPWSTCPMMVTIGALSRSSSSVSATSSSISSSMDLVNSTSKPNSSAMIVIASASRRWLMDTNIPRDKQAEIIWLTDTSKSAAKSLAEMNSVTFKIFTSSPSVSTSRSRSARLSRLDLVFPPGLLPWSLARVCLIWSWISLGVGSAFWIRCCGLPPAGRGWPGRDGWPGRGCAGLGPLASAGLFWPPCGAPGEPGVPGLLSMRFLGRFLSFPLSSEEATGPPFFFVLSTGSSILPSTVSPFSESALAEISSSGTTSGAGAGLGASTTFGAGAGVGVVGGAVATGAFGATWATGSGFFSSCFGAGAGFGCGAGGVGAGFLERSTFPKTRIPSNFGASEVIFSTTGSGALATGAGVTCGSWTGAGAGVGSTAFSCFGRSCSDAIGSWRFPIDKWEASSFSRAEDLNSFSNMDTWSNVILELGLFSTS